MVSIPRSIRDLLTADEIAEEERERRAELDRDFPEPELQDVLEWQVRLDAAWDEYLNGRGWGESQTGAYDDQVEGVIGLRQVRDMRYQRDRLPAKYRQRMQTSYRVRSRLVHNEIMRVVALMTRNRPKIEIAAAGPGATAQRRAEKQTRWANELLGALERAAGQPLLRMFADSVAEASLGVFEIFQNGAFDDVDDPPEDTIEESPRDFNRRLEEELRSRGLPFGVRVVDPMSVRLWYDHEGLAIGLIKERKYYKHLYAKMRRKLGPEKLREAELPDPYSPGYAPEDSSGEVEALTYYDRRWYCYVVNGHLVEVAEHQMPGVPLIDSLGLVTSSANLAEKLQGVTWGMTGMEQLINDLLTVEADMIFTANRPLLVIETDLAGSLITDPSGKPTRIDFSTGGVPQLNAGQRIVNAAAQFRSPIDPDFRQFVLGLFQRSGLNPVSQGESPGADPSGFAINSLQAATNALYETTLDNMALAIGKLVDYVRLLIRDAIEETVYLSVPVADRQEGGTEWLGLGPDDIDETPAEVYIDPLNDVNRLAIRESLMAANQQGMVPRSVVQRLGFGADDPDAWDDEIVEDMAFFGPGGLAAMAIQEAMAIVQGALLNPADQLPAPPGPAGRESGQANLQGVGGVPAEPQGATVGREVAGSSVGARNAARSRGGQQPRNQGVPVSPQRGTP